MHKLLWLLLLQSAQRQSRTTVQLARIRTARAAVRGVQAARLTAAGAFTALLLAGLVAVGFLLFHIGLFLLLPWTLEQRAWLLLILGALYLLAVGIVATRLLRDRFWMRMTGADRMVERAVTGQPLLENGS